MDRTEGAFIYVCSSCSALTGLASRLTVPGDCLDSFFCPRCSCPVSLVGEGFVSYKFYNDSSIMEEDSSLDLYGSYPVILDVHHISEILQISVHSAYELMKHKEFPLLKVGRLKRVVKEDFISWLSNR